MRVFLEKEIAHIKTFKNRTTIFSLIAAYLIALYIAICIVSIGLIIGVNLAGPEGFNLVVTFVMWPMFLFSGALFPTTGIPNWLSVVVFLDPLFYGVAALRHVMIGTEYRLAFWVNVGAIGLITSCAMAFAIVSFKRLQV